MLVSEHDAALFDGTVRAAVDGRRSGPTERRGSTPCWRRAGVDEMLGALPDGLDTRIADRGLALSGGQRQRLALARALAADRPVLVLHEPTTAVDAVTEDRIAAGLRAPRAGRTTVVLTTSPALLPRPTGSCTSTTAGSSARGRHDDLLGRATAYRALVTR